MTAKYLSKNWSYLVVLPDFDLGRAPSSCMYIQRVMTCLQLNEISFFVKVRIGRIAGQYAKPRSSSHETIDGKQVMSFRWEGAHRIRNFCSDTDFLGRGDNVNGYAYGVWAFSVP